MEVAVNVWRHPVRDRWLIDSHNVQLFRRCRFTFEVSSSVSVIEGAKTQTNEIICGCGLTYSHYEKRTPVKIRDDRAYISRTHLVL